MAELLDLGEQAVISPVLREARAKRESLLDTLRDDLEGMRNEFQEDSAIEEMENRIADLELIEPFIVLNQS